MPTLGEPWNTFWRVTVGAAPAGLHALPIAALRSCTARRAAANLFSPGLAMLIASTNSRPLASSSWMRRTAACLCRGSHTLVQVAIYESHENRPLDLRGPRR